MKYLLTAVAVPGPHSATASAAQRESSGHQPKVATERQIDGNHGASDHGEERNGLRNSGGLGNQQCVDAADNDHPHWSAGDRASDQYWHGDYVVGDRRQRHLRVPPWGYQWLRNDNDQYVMAAIASGIIREVVAQNQYRGDYQWSKGERLSGGYLDSRYTVTDWSARHLYQPGRGYHWVNVNSRFLLTAVDTGAIKEAVDNRR